MTPKETLGMGYSPTGTIVAKALAAMALICTLASPVHAQDASIIGVVTDSSGGLLPGVTVTATSPALQVREVTVVTDERGSYRVSPLVIGTYTVTYALSGFQTLKREGLRLTAGFTATVDVALSLGSLEETITVAGASPVVDAASSTPKTTLTRETMELLPTSRNGVQAILTQAPGVRSNLDVGGNTTGAIPQYRAFGNAVGNWPVMEGVPIRSPDTQGSSLGGYIDFQSLDEAVVSTTGNTADVPTRGISLKMIVKSGGNTFHGNWASSWSPLDLISDNVDDSLRAQNIAGGVSIIKRYDHGGDLGGRILRDRLWFYGGARRRVNNNAVPECSKPDGSVCETDTTQKFGIVKATYQITKNHSLIGLLHPHERNNVAGASRLVPWNSRNFLDLTTDVNKLEWKGILRNNLVANALVGYWNFRSIYSFPSDNGGPSTLDLFTQKAGGASDAAFFANTQPYFRRWTASSSLSWYLPKTIGGDHNIKAGFDYMYGGEDIFLPSRPDPSDYVLLFNNGVASQIRVRNNPTTEAARDRYVASYLMDQWKVGSRLTLNLGVRAGFDQAFVPAGCRQTGAWPTLFPAVCIDRTDIAPWNTVVPRLHASYDLTGNGHTLIKGGYGRFAAQRGAAEAVYLSPLVQKTAVYRWRDLNGNRDYDPGEVILDPNGPDFVSQTGFQSATQGVINLDEKPTTTDELTLSFERQLLPGVAARVTGIYSRNTNVVQTINPLIPYEAYTIPITGPDPGPDARLGTADDPGTTITYFEYPTSLRGGQFVSSKPVNDSRLDQSYKSFEMSLSRRYANRWQALGSFSITKIHEPAQRVNPNQGIFGDNNTTEWIAKLGGSYELPFGVLAAVNYELRQGTPWQRTHLFVGGTTIPNIVLPLEPLGTRRLDNLHLVDARFRKIFKYSQHRLAVGVDAFNLLNINTLTAVNNRSGSTFGYGTGVSAFIPGRNVQITGNYSF